MNRLLFVMPLLGLLVGCAASPFETAGRDVAELTPAAAAEAPGRTGATVIWGGRIVGVVNTGQATELEVVSLPLRLGHRPNRDADGGQRFVIRHDGFLEPMTFAPGRYITALGTFSGVEPRSVGAFRVDHPVLAADQLELWPVTPNSRRSNVSFGIGVSF